MTEGYVDRKRKEEKQDKDLDKRADGNKGSREKRI